MDAADAHASDPPLLSHHSDFRSYHTSRFLYPDLRVFFRQHAKAGELPAPLPLLVCIPGLGGSVAQFYPLLSSLVDLAPCLAIDYPRGGRSAYGVTAWDAYTSDALLELLETVIDDYRDKDAGQTVVLIGHSMGTALAAALASKEVAHTTSLPDYFVGLVAVCPVSGPWDESTSALFRALLWIPGCMFALWRAWDSVWSPESPSVARFVGEGAEPELKLLQYRFNRQSRTPVWRRMAYSALPVYAGGKPVGGIPGLSVWAGLDLPVYLIAGEKDHLTPPTEMEKIADALGSPDPVPPTEAQPAGLQNADAAAPVGLSASPKAADGDAGRGDTHYDQVRRNYGSSTLPDSGSESPGPLGSGLPAALPSQPQHPAKVVQSMVMPAPANHTLLYMPRSARALAGLASEFLATSVTGRLSLAWQLQHLSREGKWDVKNLIKWKSVGPVSDIVGPPGRPVFRAMKTLREADDVHFPMAFVEQWGAVVKDVVDISKDQPVLRPPGTGARRHALPQVPHRL